MESFKVLKADEVYNPYGYVGRFEAIGRWYETANYCGGISRDSAGRMRKKQRTDEVGNRGIRDPTVVGDANAGCA